MDGGLLVYSLAHDGDSVGPIGWFFVALALLGDVSSWMAASRRRQYRRYYDERI